MIFSKDLVEINAVDVDFTSTEASTADRHSMFSLEFSVNYYDH
jgi:hypothetical protein